MTLEKLFADIRKRSIIGDNWCGAYENSGLVKEFIKESITYPLHFEFAHARVSKGDNPMLTGEGDLSLWIGAEIPCPVEDIVPVVTEAVALSREAQIPKKTANFRYAVFWNPEEFIQEKKLTGQFFGEITARTVVSDRFAIVGDSNYLEAISAADGTLRVVAKGEFRRHLEGLYGSINATSVELHLSARDCDRIIRSYSTKLQRKAAEKLFKRPESLTALEDCLVGGDFPDLGTTVTISGRYFDRLRSILHKPLFDPPSTQRSRVEEVRKEYGIISRLSNTRLKDLQQVVLAMEEIDPRFPEHQVVYARSPFILDARKVRNRGFPERSYLYSMSIGPNTVTSPFNESLYLSRNDPSDKTTRLSMDIPFSGGELRTAQEYVLDALDITIGL